MTIPKLSERQNIAYEKGKRKLLQRSDKDPLVREFEEQSESCTFRPRVPISNPARVCKSIDKEAERRKNESIQKDIEKRRKAY